MIAQPTVKNPKLFAYSIETNQIENDADAIELYKTASKDKAKRLVIFGGLHGYAHTGEPTGQDSIEKGVCSFSMGDRASKGVGKGINFIYENIGRFTTDGSDVTEAKQREIVQKIGKYLESGQYYVLVSWCYSRVWLMSSAL